MTEMEEAQNSLKEALWTSRRSLIRLVLFVWAFLAGAATEHYFPGLIERLWQ